MKQGIFEKEIFIRSDAKTDKVTVTLNVTVTFITQEKP